MKYCEKCGFHFGTEQLYDSHLVEQRGKINCDQNRNRMLPLHMEIYLKSQCRDKLVQVAEIEEEVVEIKKEYDDVRNDHFKSSMNGKQHLEPFMCPIKDCGESQASKFYYGAYHQIVRIKISKNRNYLEEFSSLVVFFTNS